MGEVPLYGGVRGWERDAVVCWLPTVVQMVALDVLQDLVQAAIVADSWHKVQYILESLSTCVDMHSAKSVDTQKSMSLKYEPVSDSAKTTRQSERLSSFFQDLDFEISTKVRPKS